MRKFWIPVSRRRPFIGQPPTAGIPSTPPKPVKIPVRQRVVFAGAVVSFGLTFAPTSFGTVENRGLKVSYKDQRDIAPRVGKALVFGPRRTGTVAVIPVTPKFTVVSQPRTLSQGRVFITTPVRRPTTAISAEGRSLSVVRVPDKGRNGRAIVFAPKIANPILTTGLSPKGLKVSRVRNDRRLGRVIQFGPKRTTSFGTLLNRVLDVIQGHHVERRGIVFSWKPKSANPSITGSLKHGLIRISNFQISLNVKREVDSGDVAALSTDVSGTAVLFNKAFKDIDSITCTVDSVTEPFTVIYNFVDIPNPTGFSVFVFDTTGNRVSKTVSWKARGIV